MTRTWGLRHPRIHRGAAAMNALVGDANGVGHHAACLRASSANDVGGDGTWDDEHFVACPAPVHHLLCFHRSAVADA